MIKYVKMANRKCSECGKEILHEIGWCNEIHKWFKRCIKCDEELEDRNETNTSKPCKPKSG